MHHLMAPSILLSTIVGTIVGLKLLIMASRTRQFPELAVGAGLFCYAAIAQPSVFATHAIGAEGSFGLRMTLLALRLAAYYVTLLGLSFFAWRVFDPSSTWRKALVAFLAVTALGTVGGTFWAAWHQSPGDVSLPLYGRFGATPQYTIMFAWMAVESLHYQRLMKKRQRLGLADPVVTNRFGIWGGAAAASSVLVLSLTVLQFVSSDMLLGADPLSSALITTTGLVNTFGWWLTFIPPVAYTRWIKARAQKQAAGDASHG